MKLNVHSRRPSFISDYVPFFLCIFIVECSVVRGGQCEIAARDKWSDGCMQNSFSRNVRHFNSRKMSKRKWRSCSAAVKNEHFTAIVAEGNVIKMCSSLSSARIVNEGWRFAVETTSNQRMEKNERNECGVLRDPMKISLLNKSLLTHSWGGRCGITKGGSYIRATSEIFPSLSFFSLSFLTWGKKDRCAPLSSLLAPCHDTNNTSTHTKPDRFVWTNFRGSFHIQFMQVFWTTKKRWSTS